MLFIILRNAAIFDQDCETIERRACDVVIHITPMTTATVVQKSPNLRWKSVRYGLLPYLWATMLLIKTEQEQALEAFSRGKIVFVSLPTGYGRSQLAGNNNKIILLLRLDELIFFKRNCE